jgi:hypothetical protein
MRVARDGIFVGPIFAKAGLKHPKGVIKLGDKSTPDIFPEYNP